MSLLHFKISGLPQTLRAARLVQRATLVTTATAEAASTRHVKEGWEAIIGIEVHAQISSKTKLFSATPTSYEEPVNSKVSAIDLAFPGVQPRLNSRCVELAIRTALALKSTVQLVSSFDRKHYFYPDLPQGYQITQHREPIARGGMIELGCLDGLQNPLQVGIHQIQLEQDTGKSIHDLHPGFTLLDMNRAGTGLMEIVTKPDMRTALEASLFVKKLQAILRAVGSSEASMSEGSMRCDVNISVHRIGEPFGTRCEVKNLNSVRFLSMAIEAEIERQIDILKNGGRVMPETRGFDVTARKTFSLRSKETAPDYRYMPEADLPKLILSQDYVNKIASSLPELPDETRDRLMKQYNISLTDAQTLLNEPGSVEFFEKVCQGRNPQTVLNWTLHELFGELGRRDIPFRANPVSTAQMASLIDMVHSNSITGQTAKKVLRTMIEEPNGASSQDIVEKKGWGRIGDKERLIDICRKLTNEHPDQLQKFKSGEIKMFKWFIGQLMRETKGMADPKEASNALCEVLGCKLEDITNAEHSRRSQSKKNKPQE